MTRKRRRWFRALLPLPALALACSVLAVEVVPLEPAPAPRPMPDGGLATCATAAANVMSLGGCDMLPHLKTFEHQCEKLNSRLDLHGNPILAIDVVCLTVAPNCETARMCD